MQDPDKMPEEGSAAIVPLAYPAGEEASRTARAHAKRADGEGARGQYRDPKTAAVPAGAEAKEKRGSAFARPWAGILIALVVVAAIVVVLS